MVGLRVASSAFVGAVLLGLTACSGGSSDTPNTNTAPVASIVASVVSGTLPLTVTFDASGSSDSDGTVSNFSWDFGDGNSGTGEVSANTFNSIADFIVTLTVTDDAGATSHVTTNVTVTNVAINHILPLLKND